MDKARLTELTARAEKAKELAEEIDTLDKANPRGPFARIQFRIDNIDCLPRETLEEVIDRGRKSLMAQKEAELERLLGGDAPSDDKPACPIVPIVIPVGSSPSYDGPSTCDQTPQPFAEISCAN